MTVAFFVLGALSAVSALFAVFAPRRPLFLGWLGWVFGLVPSELPFTCLAWNALLLAVFGLLGAFDGALGIAGLVLVVGSMLCDLVLARWSSAAGPAIEDALRAGLGSGFREEIDRDLASTLRSEVPLAPVLLAPFGGRHRDVARVADIAYGDAGERNLLDLYLHRSEPEGSPVLVYVHGGAWTKGRKSQQGMPIVHHFASRGWLCVAPNYRLSPDATFPDPLVDVKRVIAWVREHAHEHGGDPTQLFLTGGSAGGHLITLAALTQNDPAYQPGFESADTSFTAAIPLYADYDWLDTNGERARRKLDRTGYFVDKILKCTSEDNRALWEAGSPLYCVRPDAPPFFVVHGGHDSLLLVEDARHFVDALRAGSRQPVAYAELPGAQHAFDGFASVRCGHVINGMEAFTSWVRSTRTRSTA